MTQTDSRLSPHPTDSMKSTWVLYVGGLSTVTGEEEFRSMLAAFGSVAQARLVRHKHSQQSAGFGFVHMYSRAQALTAIHALDGTCHNGQHLRLYLSREAPLNSPSELAEQKERA